MNQPRAGAPLRYGLAVLSSVAALLVTLLLQRYLAHGKLTFFLISVVASAWFGGLGPGLLATVLSVLLMDYFFLAPTHSLAVQSADDISELVVYSLVAVTISVLQNAQEKARRDLETLNAQLEGRVKDRTSWLSLVYDMTGTANETETVDQAFRFALKRITTEKRWRYSQVCTPLPEDPGVFVPTIFHAAPDRPELLKLQDSVGEVRVTKGLGPVGRVRETGAVTWIPDVDQEPAYAGRGFAAAGLQSAVAFPVVADRRVVAVVECFSDARIDPDPQWTELLSAVGVELGFIVERKQLQEGYSEAVWQQQRRTAQELHDGLGQRLTGLWLLATSLSKKLQSNAEAPLALKLSDGLEKALEEIRGLAKGVFPVDLDSEGLMSALKELVEGMGSASGVSCRFECPDPVLVPDNRVAMHLFRIAQEAISNALKHGRPREVVVGLCPTEEGIQLRVADDGTGLPAPGERKDGAGLRIMRYRAAAMDAILRFESNGGRGTLVTCLIPRGTKG